jgi:shikimate kinase
MCAEEKRNIVLCGFMGTGKSSVGKRLAEMVQYDFLDLDAAIETEAGITIPQIFSSQGESAFRILESRMVERIAGRTGCVIAAGGGTIVDPKNLNSLKSRGILITLTADISIILQRIGSGDDRPMLRKGDRIERIRTLLEQRAPVYAQADIMLDTSTLTVEEVSKQLIKLLRGSGLIP